jgi:hypothetical protein
MSKKAQHDYYYNTNYEVSGPSAPPIEDFTSPFSDPIDSKTDNGPAFNPNVPPVSSSSLAPPHENPFYTPGPQNTGDYMPYDDTEPLTNPFEHYQDDELLPPPPDYSLYRAVYSTHKNGVTSRDRHINQDGEALVQFLYENNTPPRLKVKLYGQFIVIMLYMKI